LLHQIKSLTMKKLFTNTNPFILLLAPVMFALIMGISYQFEQKKQNLDNAAESTVHATSLFVKGISLVKAVCTVSNQAVW
jgi:cytochrome c biogenesis protein CcdA